jgi:hypothetical protein
MRTRPITVIATALALLATAPLSASAQDQTPTPTPTATPTATPSASSADAKKDWPKDVQRVYDDYRRDGVIDVCDHTQQALQKTLDTIEPAYDQDYPDFREAVSAGIERHEAGKCTDDSSSSGGSGGGGTGAGAGAGAGASPTPAATASPSPSATTDSGSSDSGAESGALPPSSDDSGSGSDSGTVPPEDDVPPAATATPAATPPPAATATPLPATPAVSPEPAIVHTGHRSLAFPIALIALAILAALGLIAFYFFSRRNPRVSHAWQEAAFRTRGTWADFSDWLRLGR